MTHLMLTTANNLEAAIQLDKPLSSTDLSDKSIQSNVFGDTQVLVINLASLCP